MRQEIYDLATKMTGLIEQGEDGFFEKLLPEGIDPDVVTRLRQYENDFVAAAYLAFGKDVILRNVHSQIKDYNCSFNMNVGTEEKKHVMNIEFRSVAYAARNISDGMLRDKYLDCNLNSVSPEVLESFQQIREELLTFQLLKKSQALFD